MSIDVTVLSSASRERRHGLLRTGVSAAALIVAAMPLAAAAQGDPQTTTSSDAADNTGPAATTGGAGQVRESTPTAVPTADDTDTAPADGDIVVTGIRASLQGARDRKRNAEQVIDSITAQDIGALPDRSVSEALQRVPGITLQRTNEARDPARLSSEGGGVFIRGLSFVRSELNGRDVFSANNGRGLSFEDVSADLLAGVDVYKNPSAELVEGGIGGIINLRTRKPFDAPGYVFAFSGDSNYADLRKKAYLSGNVLGSGRWQTGLGEIGVLLSYSISNIGNRTDSISNGRYDRGTLTTPQDGLAAGTNVYIPVNMGLRRIDWQQKRTAFDGSLQWKPSSTLLFTAEALISQATPRDIEYAIGDNGSPPTDDPTYQFGDNNELVSGTIGNRQLNLDTRSGYQRKKTQDFSGNVRWTPSEHWAIGADVQYVKSTAQVVSMTSFTQVGVPTTFDFDFSGNDPKLVMTPTAGGALTDKSLYWWAAAMDHLEDNEADEWATRADVEYTFDDGSLFKSFRLGGRYTDRNAITRQTGYNWNILSNQYWSGPQTPTYLTATGIPGGPQNAALPLQTDFVDYRNFFRGNVAHPGGGFWFPAAALMRRGPTGANEFLSLTKPAGSGWSPLDPDLNVSALAGGGINDQTEKTYGGYALLRFGQDNSFAGHFDGNIGVRVIKTETGASGSGASVPAIPSGTCTVGTPIATGPRAGQTVTAQDCATFATAQSFAGGSLSGASASASGDYTDVLPSLNLRFFVKDNIQLRLAAAKAIVRPTFAQLNPFVQLGLNFTDQNTGQPGATIASGVGVDGRTTAFTGTAGNPNLKPTRSDQFDASLEWYFGRSNSITLAGFYKRISNYIFAGTVERQFTSTGANGVANTVNFDVTQLTNGSRGTIKGAEVAYTQFFDGLPGALSGLGFQGNFTFVDSNGGKNTSINVFDANQVTGSARELPLEGLSKYSFNVAGIYEKYGISARMAYNWRSNYLLTTSAANINYPVWSEKYGQLDGSFLYTIDKHFKIGVQATNLLNSRTFLQVGDPDLKPRYSWTDTDRRFAILVRGVF